MGYKRTSRHLDEELFSDPEVRRLVLDKAWAHKLYSALCNTEWQPTDVLDILKENTWSASWRSVGGIVADLRREGGYLDWYCSGYEGYVHSDIRKELLRLGWVCVDEDNVEERFGGHPSEDSWGVSTGLGGSLDNITAFNEFLATKIEEDSDGSIQ